MNTSAQDISYLSKHPFELDTISREKWPWEDSLMLWLKKNIRNSFQQDISNHWYQKACELFREKTWIKLTKQIENQMFQYIFEYENYDKLIDLRENFSIKLFKELSIWPKFFEANKDAFEILDSQRQITKDSDWIHSRLIMRPWDIEIIFKDSLKLSTSVKQFDIPRKNIPRVIVKWKDCFLQTKTPDYAFADDLLAIEVATQEDIKNVFELMSKIL
jgi:hypothetical protein